MTQLSPRNTLVVLTTDLVTSDGHAYNAGEVGRLLAKGKGRDRTLLVEFEGRPPMCCSPGRDCQIVA